jgi:hypothetical protein
MLRSATGRIMGAGERIVMRRTAVLLMVLAAMLVLASGVALAATLKGTAGNDEIYGTTQNDTIYGLGGDDELYGSALTVEGSGIDSINGGWGNDVLNGRLGPDTLTGSYGNDWLADGPIKDGMKDTLAGGPGYDTIISNNYPRATDAINCGTGYDTVYADSKDTFVDRGACEKVTVYNPTSATDDSALYIVPDPNYVDPCANLDPDELCYREARPRFR